LLEAKDEVDPLVKVLTDVLALQRLAHDAHKLVRAVVRPRRQLDVAQHCAVLPLAQVEAVAVEQKLRVVVELRGEGRDAA
jgi:hypothetical protein